MKRIIFLIRILLIVTNVFAQNEWALDKCINYALENNLTIKQYELNSRYQQNQLQQSKNNRLPNLSANFSQDVSFGRSLTIQNTYESFTSNNSNLSANSSVVIWQGGILNNTIKQRSFDDKVANEELNEAKDDIILNITSLYLDVLLAQELVDVAKQQVLQTGEQITLTKQMVDAGNVARGTLLEIESQLAREQLEVVNTENELKLALLNLAQLLELENYEDFSIVKPVFPELKAQLFLSASNEVYNKAVEIRPEVKRAGYQLKSSKAQLDVAYGGFMPTLSASAGIYDNYLNTNQREVPDFFDQLSDNHRESIELNLNIPIFSRFANRTSVNNAKLQVEQQKLELENVKKELRKQIEQAHANAVAAFNRYVANKKAVKSMQESFRYIEEKYNAGRVNTVEYSDAKTRLAMSKSSVLQAKYEFIFRSKILGFYNGVPISL
jgi:outer membrane protein